MIIAKTRLTNCYIFLPSRYTVLYSLGFLDFVLHYARSHWLIGLFSHRQPKLSLYKLTSVFLT